jgi:hypothetical protein
MLPLAQNTFTLKKERIKTDHDDKVRGVIFMLYNTAVDTAEPWQLQHSIPQIKRLKISSKDCGHVQALQDHVYFTHVKYLLQI